MHKDIVIFDIDGTLTDCSERRVKLAKTKDFDSFEASCGEDKPNIPVVRLFNALALSEMFDLYLVTGRQEKYREITEKWVEMHLAKKRRIALFMRANDDNRCDTEAKLEMVKYIKDRILFVVDDRQKVVDMWRANGITCLQCADFKG